ncbi:MAG: hypothetical protein QCH31_04440 [Methanolobus sp.]|nr:hypothetical protein [Methanolobus sp.]
MVQEKRFKKKLQNVINDLSANDKAFSSSIDACLFLILVSISAVILMPSIAADYQYSSAHYISAQQMDTYLLNTIMSSTLEEYEYTLEPGELAGIDVNLSQNSILQDTARTLFTKEQRHRTFSDLVAEGLVLGLVMEKDGTEKALNPMTQMQRTETEKQIAAHLERTIGQRYYYRFEAHWQPVTGHNIRSGMTIGDPAPDNAIKQKVRISMPVIYPVPMEEIYAPFNETGVYNAFNSNDPESEFLHMFGKSIEVVSSGCAELITDIVFPYDYLSSLNGTEIAVNSEQLAFLTGPQCKGCSSPVMQSVLGCMNYTVSGLYGLNVTISPQEQSIGLDLVDMVHYMILEKNKDQISAHIIDFHADDINHTIALMCNTSATDNSTRNELVINRLDAIYRTANPGGADIVLMIW